MNLIRRIFGSRQPQQTSPSSSAAPPPLVMASPPMPPANPQRPIAPSGEGVPEPEAPRPAVDVTSDDIGALAQALSDLLKTKSWTEKRHVLEAHHELLLTDATLRVLFALAQHEEQQGATQKRDFLILHLRLLANAREQGIAAAWPQFLREAQPFSGGSEPDLEDDLFIQWLTKPTYLEQRRFLQQHPEIISNATETRLQGMLETAMHYEMSDPREKQNLVEAAHQNWSLLRDIRARIAHFQQTAGDADEQRLMHQTIQDVYVNWLGGFMLDIPIWLETIIEQTTQMRQQRQPYATARPRVTLWQNTLQRAQHEGVADEVCAAIANRLWEALYNIADLDKAAAQESGIAHLIAYLHKYTEEHFPMNWAMIQHNLATTYSQRIQGNKADNLEEAIAYYTATLRVRTEATLPMDWAATLNNLGNTYLNRIQGNRANNLEAAIACYTAALRVYTEATLPIGWAMTQHNLGNTYFQRIQGNRADNLEAAIACYTAALRVRTEATLPMDWAATLNSLGASYQDRIQGNRADNLEAAIAYYTATLRVYIEATLPIYWAVTQNNLGISYQDRIQGNRADNLEAAIACYTAALRVHTETTLPHEHRVTILNLAQLQAQRGHWDVASAAYRSALRTEEALVALAGGAKGQDAILSEGHDGPARAASALMHLGQLAEAAVTLERGRARGLASARSLDAADPQNISDPARRAAYLATRTAWQAALATVQQAEQRLPLPEHVAPALRDALRRQREEQHDQQRLLVQRLSAARAAFDATVDAIRAAHDPSDFLRDEVREATLLQAARRGPVGHAIVALVATPWGGMALGAFSADPRRGTSDRFAALDLPAFTDDVLTDLMTQTLDGAQGKVLGGFGYAQEGSILEFLRRDWVDRQRPTWDGTKPLQAWEAQDAPRHTQAIGEVTFHEMAAWLHETCDQRGLTSTLDAACQDVVQELGLYLSIATPWRFLKDEQVARLRGALHHAFLLREIERGLTTLSDLVMRPLATWLRAEGVTSVTLIPCGYLATFPLLVCDLGGGQTFADTFTASVAPSFRSLLLGDRTRHNRSGVATLGNPWPTQQPLKYGQAEALTLAHLGGDPARCRIQGQATRDWLLECLRTAQVVDASCHGAVARDYLASCLLLADHPLTLADALNQQVADPAGLRLLILSACQTAIPDIRGARDEVRSLAVGMLQARVEAIIAALWSVDDRATYLLIVRFAQEWFPHRETEPPAAALARAQRWLREATWGALQSWEAESLLPAILATMPNYRPADQRDPVAASAGRMATVRGGEGYLVRDTAGLDEDDTMRDERHTMHEGAETIRTIAERRAEIDPHHRPYAHPFFWAGFQVTGW